ncbi:MAG: stage II sporulation protein M [Chloroflexi bacterium]|nr:stage II sporulation protein M [Chloroflexota bacterium]
MLHDALIITRREVRDSLRDWRIVAPIVILTLVFPWIMNLSTRAAFAFVEEYNAQIIPARLVPFAVMIVGFFPISFSLIIALETFVGERERNSLEPLLGTPISDAALYLGKLLAATLPPVMASYLGMTAYLIGMALSAQPIPDWSVLTQIALLTTTEALVMVAGAVVVSSHTTSVRAANLLASFIIIPTAFLIQVETALLFWGAYQVLWFILIALIVALALLIRTGVRTFNREEILAREVDEFNLAAIARMFRKFFIGEKFSLGRIYRYDLPRLVRANGLPIIFTSLVMLGGAILGWGLAVQYPVPTEALGAFQVDPAEFQKQLDAPGMGILPRLDTWSIFFNNTRALLIAAILALFSFGALALILLLLPVGIVGFFAGQAARLGTDAFTFLVAFILPHGIVELPAAILATAFALRMGASIIAPPPGMSAGENLIRACADFLKIFVFLILPFLLIAAWVEATLTPQVVLYIYGR